MEQLRYGKRADNDQGDEKKVNETVLLIAGLAGAMLIMILYIAVKDKETSRKMAMMEAGIDALNREIFKISKELEEMAGRLAESQNGSKSGSDIESVEKIVNHKLKPFLLEIEYLRERVEESRECMQRLDRVDEKIRQVLFANDHAAPDEQKILQLHAQGMDSESIAKQLRLGKGEVELVLKFSRLGTH